MDLLAAFTKVYNGPLARSDLTEEIQKVKDALFRRDYDEAFGSTTHLEAYVVRWSPSRALAYASIFSKYDAIKDALKPGANILCIGGGAGAEVAALATFAGVNVTTIDKADWEPVVRPLAEELGLNLRMIRGDILDTSLDFSKFNLITSLFTTNELFTSSRVKTVKLFQAFEQCGPGTILVVLESAGSYSEVQINGKTFPMHFLLDHVVRKDVWERVNETNSEWYRLPPDMAPMYTWKLENMRYMLRIYRRK